MDSVEAELKKINTNFELMSNEILKTQGSGAQMKELTRDNEINGINVMTVPSRDAYSFGLHLMDNW